MLQSRVSWLLLGVVTGLVIGLNVAGLWPQIPVHAVATHGQDSFAICTAPVDDEVEAVCFLDFLTGDLKAAVLSLQTGKFNAFYEYNVAADLGGGKNPRYLMVSGIVNTTVRRGPQNMQFGRSVIYVAEITSGQMAAYALPWNSAVQARGAKGPFVLVDRIKFRTEAIRAAQ